MNKILCIVLLAVVAIISVAVLRDHDYGEELAVRESQSCELVSNILARGYEETNKVITKGITDETVLGVLNMKALTCEKLRL